MPTYPKYVTQILNLANQNAQGTRPKVVGQMSELIQEFDGRTIEEWTAWYRERHPNAVRDATERIERMVENLRVAIASIDHEMIRTWVEDLVLLKTFAGLRFQVAILKRVAEEKGTFYKLASKKEEARGIDGYIGHTPASIKPLTYTAKKGLVEEITVQIIYYEKTKSGLVIYYDF